jgi:hypothetical protein
LDWARQDKFKNFKNLFCSGALMQCWIELGSLAIELNDLYPSVGDLSETADAP